VLGVYEIGRLFGLSIVNCRAGPSFLASCVVDQLFDGMNDGEMTPTLQDIPNSLVKQNIRQASKQPCTR